MARCIKYVFLILLIPLIIHPQNYPIKFDHISRDKGLPHSLVNYIFKDSDGFIWIATQSGLCRYDGYGFKIFQPDPHNPQSLSHSYIWTIYETVSDSGNFLWIGTMAGGLCKLDKKREIFTTYNYNKYNPNCISSDMVRAIVPDHNGNLWIGTDNGLNYFDPKLEKFRYISNDANNSRLNKIVISAILKDFQDFLWIGTENDGLIRFNPENYTFISFKNDPLNHNSLSDDCVWSLSQDSQSNLWIGTKNGLNRIAPEDIASNIPESELNKIKFHRYMPQPGNDKSLSGPWVLSILEDQFGYLWVATYGDGLNRFDKNTNQFMHYKTDPFNPYSLGNQELKCLYEDREENILWIGTAGDGIYKYAMHKNQFGHYYHNPRDKNSLAKSSLLPILEDQKGKIWIGTRTNGLDCYDPVSGRFSHYIHDHKNPFSLPNNQIQSIYEDRHQNIWIGTSHGLARYDPYHDRFSNFIISNQKINMLWVHDICEEFIPVEDELWLGCSGGGLIRFNYQENKFISYTADPDNENTLSTNRILTLYPDPNSTRRVIWIGTEHGLNKFDIDIKHFTRYVHERDNPFSISNNQVFPVYRDRSGVLWIGTHGGGLNRFDEQEDKFYYYTKKDGLPDNNVVGILEDDHGYLWLSTFKGLSRFDPKNETFKNFDSKDGLQSDQFSVWSHHKAKNGLMYFGGINGLTVFHPDSIRENLHIPPVKIIDFRLFHKSVRPGPNSPLKNSILNAQQIILSYDQDNISFEFSALSYAIPSKNHYAYKMEGVDPEWIYTDAANRIATYTNMAPGEYIFRMKGSNNDGIWNEEGTSVRIIIMPPWWQTGWAYFAYILLIALVTAVIWQAQVRRLKTKHHLEMKNLETEKLKEIDRAKSRFFANISHEFRTPLTLIEGPVKQLMAGNFKGNIRETYDIILRNTQRVLHLVTQLLDLSKLESGKMRLQAQKTNIVPLLKGLVQSFASLADRKNIILKFNAPNTAMDLYIDREKFEQIINNLLSNAFKFTPEGGKVEVALSLRGDLVTARSTKQSGAKGTNEIATSPPASGTCNDNSQFLIPNSEFIQITISNTGPGIPPDQLEKIFDRFYQADDSKTRHYEGTGIGLALTKELVELHHGTITVNSGLEKHPPQSPFDREKSSLTTFTIQLPFGRDYLSDDEIIEQSETGDRRPETGKQISPVSIPDEDIITTIEAKSKSSIRTPDSGFRAPLVLIVEDHSDVRQYIKGILGNAYHIFQAEDGSKGLRVATDKQPDLIISDVMMPQMDGYEFCRRIKEDQQTSHIPVILLTARAEQDDRLEGLETGADDYLTKPFDAKELQVRVQNLIKQRRKLKERFSRDPNSSVEELAVTSLDRKFLQRAFAILQTNLVDTSFNAEIFSKEIGISHSQLYRKLHALTGHSVSSFIRLYRLKQAARMLRKHKDNVSQVCYDVGFSNPSYFSQCFRNQFGFTPSQYVRREK